MTEPFGSFDLEESFYSPIRGACLLAFKEYMVHPTDPRLLGNFVIYDWNTGERLWDGSVEAVWNVWKNVPRGEAEHTEADPKHVDCAVETISTQGYALSKALARDS